MKARDVPLLSFFTGAGFLDLGFEAAGFPVLWRNEYDESFARAFDHAADAMGRPARITTKRSVTEISPRSIVRKAFEDHRPPMFGMVGGPPCPDFSVGGKNRGGRGENGRLTQTFLELVSALRPTFFLLENVPGLVRIRKHARFLAPLLRSLEDEYVLSRRILNALEYGVPQDRERLFVVGFRRKWVRSQLGHIQVGTDSFAWPEPRFPDAKSVYPWPSTHQFGSQPRRPTQVPIELTVGPLVCDVEATQQLPNGREGFAPYSPKFRQIDEGDDSRKSFKRLHRWRYSPTAAYGNNEVHLHPQEARRLTVREALRIQSVPDEYALPPDMPLSHKFKLIGNGVPVGLSTAVGAAILSYLRTVEDGSVAHNNQMLTAGKEPNRVNALAA